VDSVERMLARHGVYVHSNDVEADLAKFGVFASLGKGGRGKLIIWGRGQLIMGPGSVNRGVRHGVSKGVVRRPEAASSVGGYP
jgi:hypothetical protein